MAVFENVTLVWFIAGVLFLFLEAITPGFFLIFFGLGALTVAAASFFAPIAPALRWGIFIVVSVVSLLAARKRLKSLFEGRRPTQNNAIDDPIFTGQYIGREVVVIQDIAPGNPGLVELNGTRWQARAEGQAAHAAGSRVRVRAIDGLTLIIETL